MGFFKKDGYMFLRFFVGLLILVQSAGASTFSSSYDRMGWPTAAPRWATSAASPPAIYDGIIRDELGRVGRNVIGAVQNLQRRAERTGKDSKVALAALLSTGYGVGGISERAATKDEQDVILQAAATAFNGLSVLEVTNSLSQWESTDFTARLWAAGPNAQTHHAVMRAFGLAALYNKAGEHSVPTIMQHVSQGFDGISFQSSIGIGSFLRNYAFQHGFYEADAPGQFEVYDPIWASYVEGFDRIRAALAGLEVKRQGGDMPDGQQKGKTRTAWPKVVFVSNYNNWDEHATYHALKLDTKYVVFQAPAWETDEPDSWRIRPHGAIFPDVADNANVAADVGVSICDFMSTTWNPLNVAGGISIHPGGDRAGQSILSPPNMEISAEILPQGVISRTCSFLSYVNSSSLTHPIFTFHCVGSMAIDFWSGSRSLSKFDISQAFLRMQIRTAADSREKTHVERMIKFMSIKFS